MPPDLVKALGGLKVLGPHARQLDLMEVVERGLPASAYEAVAGALELTTEEQDRLLQVSERTRARWKKRDRLDPATSDRLMRLARILALATAVLETQAVAVEWLREPADTLRGRSPLVAIMSDLGAEKVTNMLYQMEYGVYA